MDVFATAEFDSTDLADLAMVRLNGINGIKGHEIIKNRFAETAHRHHSGLFAVAAPIASGSSYPGSVNPGLSGYILYGNPDGDLELNGIEPAQRQDVQLIVLCDNEGTARKVSSTLRNIGGLNTQIYKK